ncbi:hypothetical protein [Terasakiella sp.]|uniref:hypothetical protein n=1 Tax=Terasakiella sp. TaxID=2034861 RepID=UPI003AA88A8C
MSVGKKDKFKLLYVIFTCIVFSLCIVASELIVRAVDGYPLWSVELESQDIKKRMDLSKSTADEKYLSQIGMASGVKEEWYKLSPPAKEIKVSHDLQKLMEKAKEIGGHHPDLYKNWNRKFLIAKGCSGHFKHLPNTIPTYIPEDDSIHPIYRYMKNRISPYHLVTNEYGHRGNPVSLQKSDKTIRIAYVGSSTTVSTHLYPFSHPELVEFWLNLWAKEEGLNVDFEVINSAREGNDSRDMEAIVRKELLPLEPDLFVYFEGSNQFKLRDIVSLTSNKVLSKRTGLEAQKDKNIYFDYLSKYSAISKRLETLKINAGVGREPEKPAYTIKWPSDVDEYDPNINASNLPSNLSMILADLAKIKQSAEQINADIAIASFIWLAEDGLILDPEKHESIFRYLNKGLYPYRYKDIKRVADFQNLTFKKFAKQNGLHYLKYSEKFPRDPDLFTDAIHKTYAGVRLLAWISFQEILPIIKKKIASKTWPKKSLKIFEQHPMHKDEIGALTLHCNERIKENNVRFDVDDIYVNNSQSSVVKSSPVVVTTAPINKYYAANIPVNIGSVPSNAFLNFSFDAKVIEGEIGFGLLDQEKNRFLAVNKLEANNGRTTVPISIPVKKGIPSELVIYNNQGGGESSKLELYAVNIQLAGHRYEYVSGDQIGNNVLSRMQKLLP